MIIHCTKKLYAMLPERDSASEGGNHPLGDWHSDLYVDRSMAVSAVLS